MIIQAYWPTGRLVLNCAPQTLKVLDMSWTDELKQLLNFTEKTRQQPEVAAFFEDLRSKAATQDKVQKQKFQDLRAAFARGLFNEASAQAQALLNSAPQHPLLWLVLAQCALELKRLSEAAAHLYRSESVGVPEELMLEMKARFCAADADTARAERLHGELESKFAKQEQIVHADRLTTLAAGTLTWAWVSALVGVGLSVIGVGACLLARNNSDRYLFGFLACVGLVVLATCAIWIHRNNKVLHEQRAYEGKV